MTLKKKFGEKLEIFMFSLSKLTMSLLRENMNISYFSPNFFFKIIFLQDEKIFFDRIFLNLKYYIRATQKTEKEKN